MHRIQDSAIISNDNDTLIIMPLVSCVVVTYSLYDTRYFSQINTINAEKYKGAPVWRQFWHHQNKYMLVVPKLSIGK